MSSSYRERHRVAVQHNEDVVSAERSVSVGPIPTADEFKKYKEVMPDLPERIIVQFEADSEHIREMQKNAQKANIRHDMVSLLVAFVCIFLSIAATVILSYLGNDTASTLAGLGAVGMIFRGIFPRKKDKQ